MNPASCSQRITPWSLFTRIIGLTDIFPDSPLFNPESYGGWQRDKERAVDIVSGCFLLIPRPLWLALGGFDPAFFMYGEEADLCLRARRIGARPMVTPESTIVHYGGTSDKPAASEVCRLLKAKATLIDRHWMPSTAVIGQFLLMFWPLARWIAHEAAARIKGDASHYRESADTWHAIWADRNNWRFGYPKPNLTAAEREAQKPILPARTKVIS